jgi:hypothetical protein
VQILVCADFDAVILEFVARTKIVSNHASWYVIERVPVVPPVMRGKQGENPFSSRSPRHTPERYQTVRFGRKTARQLFRDAVLELSYTANGMAPFAHEIGYVDDRVKLPFVWDEDRRQKLRAKMDAVYYFHLYGVTDRDEVRYIYSPFPVVELSSARRWLPTAATGHVIFALRI